MNHNEPTHGISGLSSRGFATHVSTRRHAMAGATIALATCHAASLGEACLRISREQLVDEAELRQVDALIERVAAARVRLLELADEDGAAITTFVELREAGNELEGQDMLCAMPVEIGELAHRSAASLQEFRPLVSEQVHDDLEMAVALLAGASHAAMLLLDSNLRIWPLPALLERYEPARQAMEERNRELTPVARLRPG